MRIGWGIAALLSLAPSLAHAQVLVAHDTLSDSTPTAVSCGFCAGEAFGTIFRELAPPGDGLDPSDFPLELREVQLALAAARTTGSAPTYACEGDAAGGTASVDLEVWSGTDAPTGSIRSRPGAAEPWSDGETLLWAGTVDVQLSVPEVDGESRFQLNMNRLPVVDEDGSPIVVPAPATYVRVVAWLTAGGASTLCDAQSLESPSGVPVRDDDGLVSDARSFVHAAGLGWIWSEDAGIEGDWGVRLLVLPSGAPRDGGPADRDGGAPDAGTIDGGSSIDAATADGGTEIVGGGGCSCRAGGGAPRSLGLSLGALLALAITSRRRAARARAPAPTSPRPADPGAAPRGAPAARGCRAAATPDAASR